MFENETTTQESDAPRLLARISSMAVRTVFPFVPTDDVRYYLNGINIRPLDAGGVMVTATDGHRFVIVRDTNGFAEREINARVVKDAIKHASEKVTFDVLTNGQVIWNTAETLNVFIQPGMSIIEGDYPRIEAVCNTTGYTEGIKGPVNASYIADAMKIKVSTKQASIRFFTRDEHSPLLFMFEGLGDIECMGGIAKMNGEFVALPDWLPKPGEFALQKN